MKHAMTHITRMTNAASTYDISTRGLQYPTRFPPYIMKTKVHLHILSLVESREYKKTEPGGGITYAGARIPPTRRKYNHTECDNSYITERKRLNPAYIHVT